MADLELTYFRVPVRSKGLDVVSWMMMKTMIDVLSRQQDVLVQTASLVSTASIFSPVCPVVDQAENTFFFHSMFSSRTCND